MHDHSHAPRPARPAPIAAGSLLGLSAAQRLAGAVVVSALLWLAVWLAIG
jgi:hypothetical protein